jgi:hypothetical protein
LAHGASSCTPPKRDRRHAAIHPFTSVEAVADDSVMEVSLVLIGAVFFVLGVAGLLRPGSLIKGRGAWARLLTRPFMRGRVLGGEVDLNDPSQRLITRAIGVWFVILGTASIVGGLRGPN